MEFNNLNTFNNVDAEMRELLDTMGKVIVPRAKRKACVRTSWHVPYYSR